MIKESSVDIYKEQILNLCIDLNTIAPGSKETWLLEHVEQLVDNVKKDTLEKAVKIMEDKSKAWDPHLKDAVDTLIACIRAKSPSSPS
jgi:hypothetical protein